MNRLEQIDDFVDAQFERALLGAAFDSLLGEEALLLLEGEDTVFDGVGDGELVDDDVDGLGETVDTVYGLLFDELWEVSIFVIELKEKSRSVLKHKKKKKEGDLRDSKMAQ